MTDSSEDDADLMPLSKSDDEHAAPSGDSDSSEDDADMPPLESVLSSDSSARRRGKPTPTRHRDPRQRRTAARADSDSLLRVRAARRAVGAKAAASAASSASDDDSDDSLPALVYASSSDDDSDSLSVAGGEAAHAARALCASDAATAVALADLDVRAAARAAIGAAASRVAHAAACAAVEARTAAEAAASTRADAARFAEEVDERATLDAVKRDARRGQARHRGSRRSRPFRCDDRPGRPRVPLCTLPFVRACRPLHGR